MLDLDEKEQKHVRTALQVLRSYLGSWVTVGKAIGFQPDTVERVANARERRVTASMALRVARIFNIPLEALITGQHFAGTCPRCGYRPDFAQDEPTIVEDKPRGGGGLKVVK